MRMTRLEDAIDAADNMPPNANVGLVKTDSLASQELICPADRGSDKYLSKYIKGTNRAFIAHHSHRIDAAEMAGTVVCVCKAR